MFKKEEKNQKKIADKVYNIKKIPDIFYGGSNPDIYTEQKKADIFPIKPIVGPKKNVPTAIPPVAIQKTPGATGPSTPAQTITTQTKKSAIFLYIALFAVFAVLIGLISWYYLNQAGFFKQETGKQDTSSTGNETQSQKPEETTVPTTTQEQVERDETITTSTEAVIETNIILFPGSLLLDAPDTDNDSMTDFEEDVFGTDPTVWDTDGDGYYDGLEIVNLYSPADFAPTKIIDSGLVREYINPLWNYRVYYPANWQMGVVNENDYKQVLFSTITGDYVELRVSNKAGQTFNEWFALNATQENYSRYLKHQNRFKESLLLRDDGLVAFFERGDLVFILLYHEGTTGTIPYRNIVKMMIESFRPTATSVEIPEQIIMPSPETATGTPTDVAENEI